MTAACFLTYFLILALLDELYYRFNHYVYDSQIVTIQRVFQRRRMEGRVVQYALLAAGMCWFRVQTVQQGAIYGGLVMGVANAVKYTDLKKMVVGVAVMDAVWGAMWCALAAGMNAFIK